MEYKKQVILLVLSAIIVTLSLKVGIFWDNVLFVSKVGNDLYQNGIFNWDSISVSHDAGHPPFIGTLMAVGWELMGRSLATSHWIMFPFVFGLLWQLFSFVSFFVKEKYLKIGAFVLVVSDPTLLAQLISVNPEVIQSFFFFLALNSVLRNNIFLKTIGLAFLGIVTYRGMMLCAGLFLIEAVIYIFIEKGNIKRFLSKNIILTYLIGAIPACAYLTWRIVTKGWIISHPLELWGDATQFSSFKEFLMNFGRNILVLGYQFTDFGRMILILFVLVTFYIKRKKIEWEKYNYLLVITVFSTVVIYGISLLIKNTMGHIYYIVSYLSIALLSFMLIREYKNKRIIYIGMLASLLLGNLIVYSDSFSQGWDSSLAHLPYWNLRKNAIKYMDDKELPIAETASFFPNSNLIDDIDLNGDMRFFTEFSGIEKYVFYSNVYNLSDDHLKILHQNYAILKSFEKQNVRIEIMERKDQ